MTIRTTFRKRSIRFLALSLSVHLAITTVLWLARRHAPIQNSRTDEHALTIYPAALLVPGGTKAPWTPKPPGRQERVPDAKQPATDLAVQQPIAPAAGAPVSAPDNTVAGIGSDQQSADPAFPVFSPRPPVADRSLLPSGNQQVIVDVRVSAAGEVLDATLVQGIGNGLDQIVLNTVKTWRFHPAMMNGNPVATEAELVFPFDASYPIAAG